MPPKGMTWVYFVRADSCDTVKIGQALRPLRRLSDLQIGSPVKLSIETAFLADLEMEKRIHKRFSGCRLRGEWFKTTPELNKLILAAKGREKADRAARLVSILDSQVLY